MKKHQLILLTTVLFLVLFYDEFLGLNFGLLGLGYAVLTAFKTPEQNRTFTFFAVLITTVLSSIAFIWYGDDVSFLAVVFSMALLAFRSRNRSLKSVFVIPTFAASFLSFPIRIFHLDKWLPKSETSGLWQKILAFFVIPAIVVLVFFSIYANGSEHFSKLFSDYEWNFDIKQFIGLTIAGFFVAFNFWNFWIPKAIFKKAHFLNNEFEEKNKTVKPSTSFMNLETERMGGVVTLAALCLLLVIFIITFNYEQFYEIQKSANRLSAETHERVNAVIVSIAMAIGVIMFYFKSTFNFDKNARLLKNLAKIWIALNAILVISAMAKNTEYVVNFGVTYKRLGVYAFLILAIIGLFFSYLKIQKQKTNAYLVNQMVWYFYGTILLASFINWGGIATWHNLKYGKGSYEFLYSLKFNDRQLQEAFPGKYRLKSGYKTIQNNTFLSKNLYFESLKK